MESLTNLVKRIHSCTLCEESLPFPPKPIFQIARHSKILIAGQAPGFKTNEKGRAFDDASGVRLRKWLNVDREIFYDASNFALVPMGFCYPGKAKVGDKPPAKVCATTWRQTLLKELTNCQFLIVVGKYSADYHIDTPSKNLTELVRSYDKFLPEKIILPHPSPRNNIWLSKNPWFETDVIPRLRARVKTVLGLT